jgi:hypothetical protein
MPLSDHPVTPYRDEDQLTEMEVADWLRVSPDTLQRWRTLGIGPDYHKGEGLRSRVTYSVGAIRAYLSRTRRGSALDEGH